MHFLFHTVKSALDLWSFISQYCVYNTAEKIKSVNPSIMSGYRFGS